MSRERHYRRIQLVVSEETLLIARHNEIFTPMSRQTPSIESKKILITYKNNCRKWQKKNHTYVQV